MIEINDTIEYNGEEYISWFIDKIDDDEVIHLKNKNSAICVLLSELKK